MLNIKFNLKFSVNPEENKIEEIINNIIKSPKTGDFKFDLSLCLFFISAIVFIVVLFLEHRMKNNTYKKSKK